MLKFTVVAFLAIGLLESCAIVRPGEVGVKTTLGKLKDRVYEPGVVGFNPFVTKVLRMPTRTVNREVKLNLPSKEGLNVSAEISILYHITPEMAPKVIAEVGRNYEEVLILSVFRSASADVCSRFMAKELHSGQRSVIEGQIQAHMDSLLAHRGFAATSNPSCGLDGPKGLNNDSRVRRGAHG